MIPVEGLSFSPQDYLKKRKDREAEMNDILNNGVNGINTEISKVFGGEMAKLFAAQISEEELQRTARTLWNILNQTSNYYSDSEIRKLIKNQLLTNLKEEIGAITETEEYKNTVKEKAKTIVNEIVEETHRKMVDAVSNRFVALGTGGFNDILDQYVRNTIDGMNRRNY